MTLRLDLTPNEINFWKIPEISSGNPDTPSPPNDGFENRGRKRNNSYDDEALCLPDAGDISNQLQERFKGTLLTIDKLDYEEHAKDTVEGFRT